MFRILITLILMSPVPALACAACGFGNDATRGAYRATAGLLSAVPLTMIFGGLYYIRRKHKQIDLDDEKNINH